MQETLSIDRMDHHKKKKENLYLIILWSNLTHVYKSWVNDLWNTGMTYNMTEYATNKTFYGCI